MSPHFSPDSRRIAFFSSRSGSDEIWMSESDGSQPTQLTNIDRNFLGSPRWSPSQDSIAFDSMRSGTWNIYVVGTQDRRIRQITADTFANIRPSWSRDGRWIYFGSNRSGDWQIWKIPAAGGAPIQITRGGGYTAFESPDGRSLYYAKPPGAEGIWQVPVEGGEEVRLVDHGPNNSWGVTQRGIALIDPRARPRARIEFFSFASRRIVAVRDFPAGVRLAPPSSPHLAVSPDGEWILYVQYDEWGSDIHVLEGSW